MRNIIIILILLSLVNAAGAAITGQTVTTNLTVTNDTSRAIMGTNSTLNFTFTESAGNNYTNFTFPSTMKINEIIALDIVSNQASVAVAGKTNNMLNLTYTANSGGSMYFNFSGKNNKNISLPATSGTYNISVMTNASRTANVNISLFARDSTMPYYIKSNNSVYTIISETFGTTTTTITTSGKGDANFTIFAPNITDQPNILVGWGATNATKVQSNISRTSTQTTIYLVPDSSVQDPVIILSAQNEHESGNIAAGIIAGGAALTGFMVYYRRRRRNR